jgi:hypothetical protein
MWAPIKRSSLNILVHGLGTRSAFPNELIGIIIGHENALKKKIEHSEFPYLQFDSWDDRMNYEFW